MRSASTWIDIDGQFQLQWISKTSLATRIGNHKRMATVKTLTDFFFFHMCETQMCSAATLEILDSGKIKSSSSLLKTWGRKSTKFSYWHTKSLRKVVLPYSLMIKNSPNCQISSSICFCANFTYSQRGEENMISRMSTNFT